MRVVKSAKAMQRLSARLRLQNKKIGFVPTMGYLHKGHMSLVKKSTKENDVTVMSIFVNPKQFGPREDFAKYPRNLQRDKLFAKKEKVDILFLPSADDMYKKDYLTYVGVEKIKDCLCGPFRPGHFRGVATVVAKLLNIVSPGTLYLGQKDAQQAIIIKRMVEDLNFSISVKVLPTVREKDGLAMSSRNSYLQPHERKIADTLYKALQYGKRLIYAGERSGANVLKAIKAQIEKEHKFKIDYIECRDAETLNSLNRLRGKVLIAVAAWLGKTRLIDNTVVSVQ